MYIIYIYIYIYIYIRLATRGALTRGPGAARRPWRRALWVAPLVYLSDSASFVVLCIVHRVKGHHDLLHDSPLLKKACVRQVYYDYYHYPNQHNDVHR